VNEPSPIHIIWESIPINGPLPTYAVLGITSALALFHLFVLLYGATGGRRGLRTAIAYLIALDWALAMGVSAARSIAGENTPFWSLHTVMGGGLGLLLLFLPAWLLFRMGLRFSGIFLLPVMPTERKRRQQAGRTIRAYMWGLNHPFYREEEGELEKRVSGSIMLLHGGPGFVMANSHYAIPLTIGTHDTQVGGYGLVFTGRKERPRPPVDLRLQIRAKTVRALTRDGIPIRVKMFAIFQIDHRRAKGDGLYPFDPQAVLKAVHTQGVGPEPEEREQAGMEWGQVVVDRAADLLRDGIAQKLLDQLLEGNEKDQAPPREVLRKKAAEQLAQKNEKDQAPPREVLRKKVAEQLAQKMEPHGIQVVAVGLGNIEVEDEEIRQQRVENWRARWERQRLEKEAQGEAEAIRILGKARADAQRQMIAAITEAFQELVETQTPVPAHVIALRFVDILEEMAASPTVQEWLPGAIRAMPARLRLSMGQATPGDGDETPQSQDA
jgi:regulator of protease activity HflC (stomatin/prohibitin superfamily)